MGTGAVLLGEFEQMVLLAVMQAQNSESGAYGITVFDELLAHTRRKASRGAVYMTLDRLEKKRLLRSFTTEPLAERGGRSRRCYEVTKSARVALAESRRALMSLWTGLDLAVERK